MKKFVKVIAFAMAIVTLMCMLASCGALSGKYEGITVQYEFKGSKVIISSKIVNASVEGKYTINGDKIKFEFDTDKIENEILKGVVEEINKIEQSFEKGDGYIKIGGIKYTTVKK